MCMTACNLPPTHPTSPPPPEVCMGLGCISGVQFGTMQTGLDLGGLPKQASTNWVLQLLESKLTFLSLSVWLCQASASSSILKSRIWLVFSRKALVAVFTHPPAVSYHKSSQKVELWFTRAWKRRSGGCVEVSNFLFLSLSHSHHLAFWRLTRPDLESFLPGMLTGGRMHGGCVGL